METLESKEIDLEKVEVQAIRNTLFETPVVLATLDNADRLLEELEYIVRQRRAKDPQGLVRSNEGGWHSDTNMIKWGGTPAQWLANNCIALAKKLSRFVDSSPEAYIWSTQMWANISHQGTSNQLHVHPGNLWSAVLYLNMGGDGPQSNDTSDCGGAIYFEDPRALINNMHNPDFRFDDGKGNSQRVYPEILPRRGNLLMFPSWLRHGVKRYMGTKERISIAINIDAVPK